MNLIALLIYLIVLCCVVGLVYYVINAIPVPDPLGRIIKIVVMVFACLVVILLLLQLVGMGPGINLRM
jgi:uncharacterized membrane protein required for colicin V production